MKKYIYILFSFFKLNIFIKLYIYQTFYICILLYTLMGRVFYIDLFYFLYLGYHFLCLLFRKNVDIATQRIVIFTLPVKTWLIPIVIIVNVYNQLCFFGD